MCRFKLAFCVVNFSFFYSFTFYRGLGCSVDKYALFHSFRFASSSNRFVATVVFIFQYIITNNHNLLFTQVRARVLPFLPFCYQILYSKPIYHTPCFHYSFPKKTKRTHKQMEWKISETHPLGRFGCLFR